MEEYLLTEKEINEIEEYAERNPSLKDPNLFNFGSKPTTILKVSIKNELIFVKGTKDTGFDHIHKRHDFWSNSSYWIESIDSDGNKKRRLQNQSKFRTDSTPIVDYVQIADSVYSKNNLNVEKNSCSDKFDLYCGIYNHKDNSSELYNLLLYKNSKVVHTLYPQTTKNNLKTVKKFNFARGKTSLVYRDINDTVEISIPYLDFEKKIKYSLLISKNLEKKIEYFKILIHNSSEIPDKFYYLGEQPFDEFNFSETNKELRKYQYAELKNIERIIKQIDRELNEETK